MSKHNEAEKRLLEKRIRPSFPRLRILEYLLKSREHPGADDVYRALVDDIPTLSKTTVYNALALFEEAGLVRRVATDGNEARYDARLEEHGHFRCESCGRIFDFAIRLDPSVEAGLESFLVRKRSVYYQGLCPQCRDGQRNN